VHVVSNRANVAPKSIWPLTGFEELITNDGKVRRQAVAHREDACDTVRGSRAHATQVKISGVDREAMLVKRELDLLNGETWHGPKTCNVFLYVSTYGIWLAELKAGWLTGPVLARTFGAGYEAIEGGCDSGRHVDQRCAGIYCL
jgi:hypothetical protein